MPFLTWIAAKLTGEAIKAGGEIAKTATEIPKNVVETQKARREIEELDYKRQERERLIMPATFADVERYDPKVRRLNEMAPHSMYPPPAQSRAPSLLPFFLILFIAGLVALGIYVLVTPHKKPLPLQPHQQSRVCCMAR